MKSIEDLTIELIQRIRDEKVTSHNFVCVVSEINNVVMCQFGGLSDLEGSLMILRNLSFVSNEIIDQITKDHVDASIEYKKDG